MFLKRLERRKDGKRHTYWALVESVRTAGTSRHRVVAYLGALGPREQSGWAHLARRLDRKDRPQPTLFDPPPLDEPSDDEPVLVKLKGVRWDRLRDFGDVWMALGLWRLSWTRCFAARLGYSRRDYWSAAVLWSKFLNGHSNGNSVRSGSAIPKIVKSRFGST